MMTDNRMTPPGRNPIPIMIGVFSLAIVFCFGFWMLGNAVFPQGAPPAKVTSANQPHQGLDVSLLTTIAIPTKQAVKPTVHKPTRYPTFTHTVPPTVTPRPSATPYPTRTLTPLPSATLTPSITPTPTDALTALALVEMQHDETVGYAVELSLISIVWLLIVMFLVWFFYRQFDKARDWWNAKKIPRVESAEQAVNRERQERLSQVPVNAAAKKFQSLEIAYWIKQGGLTRSAIAVKVFGNSGSNYLQRVDEVGEEMVRLGLIDEYPPLPYSPID